MTLTLDRDFEPAVEQAFLAELRSKLVGERDNIVFTAIQASHDRLDASGYDIESVKESLITPTVDESDGRITVTWGWTHPAAEFFEFGTSVHSIQGDPVLSFVWEDPPQWVREEFDAEADGWRVFFEQVQVSGVDEVRFTRHGLRILEQKLRS